MTKTIHVCDCCGTEVPKSCLHECYKTLWTGRNCDPVPKTCIWELCEDCIEHLENTLMSEIQRVEAWKKKKRGD